MRYAPKALSNSMSDTFLDGDVILRKGKSIFSSIIASAFEDCEGMSHCGFIVSDAGEYYVIHTISGRISGFDGMRKTALQDFIAESAGGRILVLRLNKDIPIDNLKQLILQKYHLNVPFDNDFDHQDSSKLYCYEFIRDVYRSLIKEDFFAYKEIFGHSYLDFSTFFQPDLFVRVFQSY